MKSSKTIDISQASLVSLKAELSRKQEEVNKAKAEAHASFIHPIPKPKKEPERLKEKEEDTTVHKNAEEQREDEELHRKSRKILEEKAKLYETLSHATHVTGDENDTYLVNFHEKSREAQIEGQKSLQQDSDNQDNSEEYDAPSDPEDDWVDYVDCLGRTRRCLRRDLDFVKEKDLHLAKSLGFVIDEKGNEDAAGISEATLPLNPQLMSNDMQRELLRKKWEEQEEILKDKQDIHYQDVLFDEARTHGVGYYAFAQHEETRKQQQEALSRLRTQTQRQQEAAKETRRRRQAALEARVRAARNRQRARLGLPPETAPAPGSLSELEEKEKAEKEAEAAKKKAEEESERIAKEQEARRKSFITRPWDVGKESSQPFQVMSQEEWVKKKRSERNKEFAPPKAYRGDKSCSVDTESCDEIGPAMPESFPPLNVGKRKGSLFFSTIKSKPQESTASGIGPEPGPGPSTPVALEHADLSKPPPPLPPPYRVSRSEKEATSQQYILNRKFKKIKNEVSNPIELSSDDDSDDNGSHSHPKDARGRGVEIAPPASCEYYGLPPIPTVNKGKAPPVQKMAEIEKSISAGLKFLRQQQEAKEKQKEKGLLDIM